MQKCYPDILPSSLILKCQKRYVLIAVIIWCNCSIFCSKWGWGAFWSFVFLAPKWQMKRPAKQFFFIHYGVMSRLRKPWLVKEQASKQRLRTNQPQNECIRHSRMTKCQLSVHTFGKPTLGHADQTCAKHLCILGILAPLFQAKPMLVPVSLHLNALSHQVNTRSFP